MLRFEVFRYILKKKKKKIKNDFQDYYVVKKHTLY